MNICILTSRFPFPEIGGDSLRINNVAKYLKSKGHRLILISFWGEKEPNIEEANQLYDKIVMVKLIHIETIIYSLLSLFSLKPIQVGYYYSHRFLKSFKKLVKDENIDIYIPHAMRMTEYIVKLGLVSECIVEQTDAISKTYILSKNGKGSFLKKTIYIIERNLVQRYEKYMLKTFPKIVYVSQSDIDYLVNKYPLHRYLAFHTNGFMLPQASVKEYDTKKICFMGNMRSLQNQDAVIYFVRDVFPLILKVECDAKFYIVGAEPPRMIQKLACENIIVTGFVDNVETVIRNACLCVAPIKIAAGIQNKVLVSMGCGVPVIMSSLIAQPIPELKDKVNCYIADDAEVIARLCIMLMNNSETRNAIGIAGRHLIEKYYSWDKTLDGYLEIR